MHTKEDYVGYLPRQQVLPLDERLLELLLAPTQALFQDEPQLLELSLGESLPRVWSPALPQLWIRVRESALVRQWAQHENDLLG